MTTLDTLLDLLPPPWTQHPASVVSAVLDVGALELDAGQEDVDRLRRTHGFDTAYRLGDLAKIVALLGVTPLPWEDDIDLLRPRARALIDAQLAGAVGKREIGHFVVDYLVRVGSAIDVEIVRGLPRLRDWEQAYPPDTFAPGHDGIDDGAPDDGGADPPLRFVEWPRRTRRSVQLGAVPYLYRWTEHNGGAVPGRPAAGDRRPPGRADGGADRCRPHRRRPDRLARRASAPGAGWSSAPPTTPRRRARAAWSPSSTTRSAVAAT